MACVDIHHPPPVQDSVSALVQDCDLPSLKRNKNVQNFLERCECAVCMFFRSFNLSIQILFDSAALVL